MLGEEIKFSLTQLVLSASWRLINPWKDGTKEFATLGCCFGENLVYSLIPWKILSCSQWSGPLSSFREQSGCNTKVFRWRFLKFIIVHLVKHWRVETLKHFISAQGLLPVDNEYWFITPISWSNNCCSIF